MSAIKFDANKPDLTLIPYSAQKHEAYAFMDGEKKYGRWNYLKGGLTVGRLMAAVFRHCFAYLWGELMASDSGVHHLGHARAGLAMIIELEEQGKLVDDRYANSLRSSQHQPTGGVPSEAGDES